MYRACSNAHEEMLAYTRRLKCKKLLFGEERVTDRLVNARFFDT
jgi:hypothetical protein